MLNPHRPMLDRLSTAARVSGVTLPEPVADRLAFGHPAQSVADVTREAVEEIAAAAGARDYGKRRTATLARIAQAEAGRSIAQPLAAAHDAAT